MSYNNLDEERLEYACVAVYQCLHEFLQKQKISAMEFLSIVEQLPIKPMDFGKRS